jgi:hypothetical protein
MLNRYRLITSCVIVLLLLLFALFPAAAAVATGPDRYTAYTEDGVDLALKRYRPEENAAFREGAQPVILMPGIIANFNEFDVYTPEGESYNVQLPDALAPWADGDVYIQNDPMRYYSLAHYLWNRGYDVWLANYRGEGREPYYSGGAGGYSVDDLGIYDVPAVVEKVYELTGKHPVWCGHSMGSSMAYIYLEGAVYGPGSDPHVVSDPALASERNGGDGKQALAGFVDLDGPMGTAGGPMIDNFFVWAALYMPFYIDLRFFSILLADMVTTPLFMLMATTWFFYRLAGFPDLGLVNLMLTVNPENLDGEVFRYIGKYALDGASTRAFAQLQEAHVHRRFREDYLNGPMGFLNIVPPEPYPGDGFYYYSDHLDLIDLPALVIADDAYDLTTPEDIENFFLWKTRNESDVFFRAPNTAHIDLVMGSSAPGVIFPMIGAWLDDLLE